MLNFSYNKRTNTAILFNSLNKTLTHNAKSIQKINKKKGQVSRRGLFTNQQIQTINESLT